MRAAQTMPLTSCQTCEAPIAQPAKGRRRRYCSEACRQRQYRRRRARRRGVVG